MGIELNEFISNLKGFRATPIKTFKPVILEIMYIILVSIGNMTITDTAQARGSVIKKFADKYFDGDYAGLDREVYDYWATHGFKENYTRSFDNEQSVLSETQNTEKLSVAISSKDAGLYAQENAEGSVGATSGLFEERKYPSTKVKSFAGERSNSNYKIRHVTYVADLVNSGNFAAAGINIEYVIDEACRYIDKTLFK